VERYEYSDFGAPVILDGSGATTRAASAIGNDVLWQGAKWHADIQLD